jgi:hypothetical protein
MRSVVEQSFLYWLLILQEELYFIARFSITPGANDEIWTNDLLITNQLLYQLNYIGECCLNN